jgi:hypothetical protein
MSVWRGIQSVIFFYLSCAPCSDASTRKKRNRQAVHDEKLRTELQAAHPDYPSQAPPGSVNPNWQIEIDSGPMIPRKQRNGNGDINRTRSKDINTSDRRDSKNLKPSATHSSTSSKAQSAVDVSYTQRHLMVYQRPDEELWGAPSSSTVNLPTRPGTARTKSSVTNVYHQARHPAVNHLHPPTTRKIANPEEVSWMLQPMPSAEVMNGKANPQPQLPVSRSNSDVSGPSPKSTKSIPAPLTPIEATYPSEETFVHTPESEVVLTKPEDWIWETTKRDVSARRSLDW